MNINEYVECLNQAYDIKCPICGRKPSNELRSMKILYQKGCEHDEIFDLVNQRLDMLIHRYDPPYLDLKVLRDR